MNLDELLKNVWTAEANQSTGMDIDNASATSSLQRQASLTLARAFSGKTVDEVWRDIQHGQKMKNAADIEVHERVPTLGEITLEDFLVKAGLFAKVCPGPVMDLDNALSPQSFTPQIGLSPSPSIDTPSDTSTPGRKRDASDVSRLEEENIKLKKEKELEKKLQSESSPESRYQLRRTSSF
ncbi:hypothetical protein F0562_022478 [Nyssa sinensis]|uniref:ABSCISIC ACID-INSENSITIVE 5-like protein 2 n=1 Tax=Nyssa sinensis TaxID=561372 RepID=A0A5J5BRY9_9ASTE|nr:hypothetical protein F0562_022478 [Nyssa sinensis]